MTGRAEPLQSGNTFGFTAWRGSSRTMSAPHAHNDIEINFCSRPLVYASAGKTFTLPPGVPCAFWGVKPHQLINFERGYVLAFATVPLAQFMSWTVPAALKNRLLHGEILLGSSDPAYGVSAASFDRWSTDLYHRQKSRRRAAELEIEALIHRMSLGRWSELVIDHTRSSLDLTRAAKMATYITENATSNVTVGAIANVVHLNSNQASALFREVFGVGINRYVSQHRVAEAQRLLLTTSLSSAMIGRQAGFQSSSSFHETFRLICDTSPSQWRRKHEAIILSERSMQEGIQ